MGFYSFEGNWVEFRSVFGRFWSLMAKKSGLLATFENESGQKKMDQFPENSPFWVFFGLFWAIYANLKGSLCKKPTYPLLFSINCDKKIKDIYRYVQNKWASGLYVKRWVRSQNHNNPILPTTCESVFFLFFLNYAKKTYPFMKREG